MRILRMFECIISFDATHFAFFSKPYLLLTVPEQKPFEPGHDKTHSKACVASEDSDQPVHRPGMARVLVYPILDSSEAVEGTCDQQRL